MVDYGVVGGEKYKIVLQDCTIGISISGPVKKYSVDYQVTLRVPVKTENYMSISGLRLESPVSSGTAPVYNLQAVKVSKSGINKAGYFEWKPVLNLAGDDTANINLREEGNYSLVYYFNGNQSRRLPRRFKIEVSGMVGGVRETKTVWFKKRMLVQIFH